MNAVFDMPKVIEELELAEREADMYVTYYGDWVLQDPDYPKEWSVKGEAHSTGELYAYQHALALLRGELSAPV
jgi:hypothetical protein